jgi:glycosyltransferase involved in cell wall biosynthesis
MTDAAAKLPITVVVAVRNEEANIRKCLAALDPARRVIVADSNSTDRTAAVAAERGAEVVQFRHTGGYPKKRQWVLDTVSIATEWVLFLDADEVVPPALWDEIRTAIAHPRAPDGFLIVKGFHFLGRRFRFGGFSFAAVLLVRTGRARFERLVDDGAAALDMEVHERVIVDGPVGKLRTPLIHDDFKGLEAYLDRHDKYAAWEAKLRHRFLTTGRYGDSRIEPRLFGNAPERRRFLKQWVLRLPCEPLVWFAYHYVVRLGFLEGRPGFIASRIRADYIAAVRAKIDDLRRPDLRGPQPRAEFGTRNAE